ncbi:ninein-like isoform X1 [Oncorhynchus tshawytscha]|uniref:EF-hand domain-containing protein n=1 Tax=Oncorhynchus tshawytscha TaxID=74940 RepID=A0AAZ3QTT4_ONCTS|nr:ninein-like isoform X1 [Oncorhynchus tshawytscha]
MDDGQQDQYEERLKEVFETFDTSGAGLLCPEELSSLCQALHLEDATPTLLHALLQNQDPLTDRVDFDQFKNALILVLSTTTAVATSSQETCAPPQPDSPVQAKFVRGSKRYGRRSTPEFIETIADFSEVVSSEATGQQEPEDHDSTVPRKRERWNAHESSTDEYEADGQLHLWNPDDPSTPRGSTVPLSDRLEERLRQACEELAMPWDGCASHHELLALCDHLGLEVTEDVLQFLSGDEVMSVQAFTSWVLNQAKPPTPSASTPYRQLKRLHSSQPFDETGRRTSCMTSSIRMCLFSTLDDGTGSTPAEDVLDAWMEEGIENSPEILQALDFDLEGKVNLRELTVALENELLVTKNGIHQAALASFKAEIRYLLERVDHERREKEKIRSDLDKAEKLKTQLAAEVDEHHSAIERMNDLNLRKLEQEHREKLVSVRSELIKEMDQIQQQKEKLEAEMEKIRDDETFLRDHLSLTVKESRCLEMELLVSTEKLLVAESQVSELQKNLDNILKEKFGDLEPSSAEFFLQEERLGRLRSSYEEQCRELQDRIDELQAELQEYHNLGRTSQPCLKPSLSEELGSTSPGMESDPGLGLEEGQPLFNMSLEAEMMLERLKEKHLREMEELQAQLESKVIEFDQKVEEQKMDLETQKAALSLHYMEEIQALHGEMSSSQNRALELQAQLEQAEEERAGLEQRQAGEMEELEQQQEEEVSSLGEQLLEARTQAASLEEQLLEARTQAASLEEQLLEARTQAASLEEQLLEARTQAASLEEQLLEARTQAASLEEQLLEAHTQAASLEEQLLEAHTQAASLEEQLLEAHTQAASLEEQLLEAHTQAASLEEQLLEAHTQAASLEEQLLEAHTQAASLEEQLLEAQQAKGELGLDTEMQELRKLHAAELNKLDEEHKEILLTRMEEERGKLQAERAEVEMRLLEEWEREKLELQQSHEETVKAGIEEVEMRLMEEWEREKAQLNKQSNESLQTMLEEAMLRLVKEQQNREARLTEQWELERARLQQCREAALLTRLAEEHLKQQEETERRLREDWDRERLQLEEEYEGVFQERLQEERQSLKEAHRWAMQELSAKHHEEREQLSSLLDKLREDIAEKRREVGRLVEENLLLTQKMSTLKEEYLKDSQKEMLFKLEHFRKEKISAQKMAERFKRQISVLRLRSQQLEDENGLLSEKNAQNAAGVEGLSQQLGELLRQSERQEAVRDQQRTVPEDERMKMAVCVTALEAELTNAVEGTVLLEEGKAQLVLQLNTLRDKVAKMGAVECRLSSLLQERKALEKQTQGLRNQLAKSQERNQVLEESLQSVDLQSARLKSDLRVSQQEKDALKQEVMSLHKQLQNGNDKNQVLEMALHSSGYQSQQKKLYQDELARLVEQEQQQLRQENERLTMELHHTREKLEAAILTVKQQGQSSVGKTVEQEKTALKRELDVMHQELLSAQNKVCEVQRELDSLRQENEGLKTQQAPLQAWLLEAQLGGLLPPSPRRMPGEWRGQHCENDHNPENIQDERSMMTMMKMEERMREIELSLHNVKLLLKEKVSQLKEQHHKNGKADTLIKDLYVENTQLLKALEMTERRQKVAEKKNYLLDEKISSLNKIVRDLSPSPLPTMPYHFTCSSHST